VIGAVVAHHLSLPHVNVCAGHNLAPGPTIAALQRDPRVRISDACHRAVEALRDHHGISDASPFSYVSLMSKDLNLYCEPPAFLPEDARAPFEPLAFFGALLPDPPAADGAALFGEAEPGTVKLYASFGTVIWRYYREQALAALDAFADAVSAMKGTAGLVSLGGCVTPETAARLSRARVRVAEYVDQWRVLGAATAMLTHQGLNSTHEAIWHRVPMLSYPFFSDQPGLAARCRQLGLAVPAIGELRGRITAEQMMAALERVLRDGDDIRQRLSEARTWEEQTIDARPEVIERIARLASPASP
jgi:UDP:flavonoid glycosyltransferase YjiC (YdhE family)